VITIESIGESAIAYLTEPPIHTREYYHYCVQLLKRKCTELSCPINICVGPLSVNFNNGNPTMRTDIQCEHMLVKEGGRSVEERYVSATPTQEGDYYLLRIQNFNYYNGLDFVLEYSLPNISHLRNSGLFKEYLDKTVHISPSFYDITVDATSKKDTLTLFTNNPSPRRIHFLSEMREKQIDFVAIDDCYSKNDLITRYAKTKILVNVHQTDHHHTFEELRALPALRNGVIVVSEEVPLVDKIPYHSHIIWAPYKDLSDTVLKVQQNYDRIYKEIFTPRLKNLLLEMEETNSNNLNIVKRAEGHAP